MNNFPLPHKFQKIAMVVFIVNLLIAIALISSSVFNGTTTARILQSLIVIIFYLSILCCLFSQEKVEDEYISSLRLRTISIVAFIGLAIIVFLNFYQSLLPTDKFEALKAWRKDHFWNGNYVLYMAVLYFVIFKFSTKLNNKEDEKHD